MGNIKINCLTRDYCCLQTERFKGHTDLAWQARRRFLHTPGFVSFEVSPLSGKVFLGFDRRSLRQDESGLEAGRLLGEYFPELVEQRRFKRIHDWFH